MNCPYCAKEMESGYLRGGSGYELLWTEEPFKMTSLPTGNDFFVCKASIRKRCGSLDQRRFPQKSITQHSPHRGEQDRAPRRICRLRRQTGSGTSRRIFCPTGRKQTLRTTIDAKTYIIVKPRRVSRRARREKILIINRRDMRVAIYSSRSANVRAYGACAAAERTPLQKRKAVLSDSLSFLK